MKTEIWNTIKSPDFIIKYDPSYQEDDLTLNKLSPVSSFDYSPMETNCLLTLLKRMIEFALCVDSNDPLYKEIITHVFIVGTVFAPLFIDNELERLNPGPMNFEVLYVFIVLAVKVCRATAISDVLGDEQFEYLGRQLTEVSFHWKNEEERCKMNLVFKHLHF